MANPGQDEEDPEEAGRKARELHEDKIRQASRRDGEV